MSKTNIIERAERQLREAEARVLFAVPGASLIQALEEAPLALVNAHAEAHARFWALKGDSEAMST